MINKVTVVVSVLAVALFGVLVWAMLTSYELWVTRDMLSSTRVQLAAVTTQLEETEGRLASTTSELVSTRSELTGARNELTSARIELTGARGELVTARNQLNSVQQASSNLQSTLSSTQQQLTIAQDTLKGLGITVGASIQCYDKDFISGGGGLVDNPGATDPTWSQLAAFITGDQTEKKAYVENVYDCSLFSRDLHNHAEAAGIRAAEVQFDFRNERIGHALNAFLTTDYGLVYVDCTGLPDRIARLEAGKTYRAVEPYRITRANVRNDYWWDTLDEYYYFRSSMGGEVVASSIRIYW